MHNTQNCKQKQPAVRGDQPFQEASLTQKCRSLVMDSPFYNVLEELRAQSSTLLSGIQIKVINKDSRNAFILTIASQPSNHLFAEYQYKECHFAIDKSYKTGVNIQHGRTPIHYTETYVSSSTGERLVVHGYLNQRGHYIYAQVKKRLWGEKRSQILEITEELKRGIKENISASTNLIQFLFETRERQYLAAKQSVDSAEGALQQAFEHLKQSVGKEAVYQAKRSAYVEASRNFVTAVQTLNLYSEIKSNKHVLVAQQLQSLEAFGEILQPSVISLTKETVHIDTAMDDSEISETVEDPLIAIYQTALERFATLARLLGNIPERYKPDNLQTLLDQQTLVEEINRKLLYIFGIPPKYFRKNNKQKSKLIYNACEKTSAHDSRLLLLLEESVLAGRLAIVQSLFPRIGNRLKSDFYEKFIDHIVESDPNGNNAWMELCHYLYENSEDYANTVYAVSEKSKYSPISGKEITQFKARVPEHMKSFVDSNSWHGFMFSALFKLYCKNNFSAFKMLLLQGANPDTWSMGVEGVTPFTLLCSIVSCGTENYFDYAAVLLEHGADPNIFYTKYAFKIQIPEKIANKKVFDKLKQRVSNTLKTRSKSDSIQLRQIVNQPVELNLVWVAMRSNLDDLKLLLSYSSLDSLAYCLAYLANAKQQIRMMDFIALGEPFIALENDKEKAYARIYKDTNSLNKQPFLSFIFYGAPDVGCESDIKKFLEKIDLVCRALAEKISRLTKKGEFEEAYKRLYAKGADQFLSYQASGEATERDRAYYALLGCDFLLTMASARLNQAGRLELAKTYLLEFLTQSQAILKQMPAFATVLEVKLSNCEARKKLFKAMCRSANKPCSTPKNQSVVPDHWSSMKPLAVFDQPYPIVLFSKKQGEIPSVPVPCMQGAVRSNIIGMMPPI